MGPITSAELIWALLNGKDNLGKLILKIPRRFRKGKKKKKDHLDVQTGDG